MMLKNDIANMALNFLGQSESISDIDTDDSIQAQVIRRNYRRSLDKMLEHHPWNFARRTAKLIKQADDPEGNYEYSYHYPINALTIRQIAADQEFHYLREPYPEQQHHFQDIIVGTTQLIYCNVKDAYAEYTERIADNAAVPNHFGEGLAGRLALNIGPSIITDNWPRVMRSFKAECREAIEEAISTDISKTPPRTDAPVPMITKRWQ